MGCHTWFYVHLPEKKKEVEMNFIKKYKERTKWWYDYCKTSSIEDWEDDFNDANEFWQGKTLEQLYKELPTWSKKDIEKNYKLSNTKNVLEYKELVTEYAKQEYLDSLSINEFNNISLQEIISDVDYIVHDDKLYFECSNEEHYGVEAMHDLFRIHDYEAKPCYSFNDVIERCQEYNVELSKVQLYKLAWWFEKYPDTIIKFM